MLNQEVREVMTKDPKTVGPDENISDVIKMMLDEGIMQIPVVKDEKLEGMVTTFDVWKNSLNNPDLTKVKVKDIMNRNVIRITPKDKLGTAAELFMDRRFKTLPVVNLENKLKGVITAFDVIKSTLKETYPRPILFSDIIES